MAKTANSIIRQESWATLTASVPPDLLKKFRKALIDSDCTPRQAFITFIHSVAVGEIKVEPQNVCSNYKGRGLVFDETGVFDDYRALMKSRDGRILNPMPFNNNFIEKI